MAAAVACALLPVTAYAHGLLRSSVPKAGAVLTVPPREIRLTFTEEPERTFTAVQLFGPHGPVALSPSRFLPGNVVSAASRSPLGVGAYRVEWRTAGDDGHPVSGQFMFTVAASTEDSAAARAAVDSAAAAQKTGGPPGTPSIHDPSMGAGGEADPFAAFGAILRWLTLVGAVAAIGAVAFRYTVLKRVSLEVDVDIRTEYLPDAARGTAMVGVLASALLALTALFRLLLQSLAVHGAGNVLAPETLVPMLTNTNWGLAWMILLVGTAVAGTGFVLARRHRSGSWIMAASGAALIAVGLALASHATIVPSFSRLSVAANIVHTMSAAGWLGNLLVVFAVGLPLAWRLDRDDRWTVVRDIVNAFSPAALAFGGLAAATGIFMAWTHVGSIAALTGTNYGNVLILKVALLLLTALTGAYNWLRVRPALGDRTGARRLRRTAGAELAIAALVLAVTAVLVALPIPQSR